MISVCFQGKPLYIMVIQVYALTSNAEEAEVEWFYEDLQDLIELTPKKDVLFIIGDWNAKVGIQEIPGITGKFGLGFHMTPISNPPLVHTSWLSVLQACVLHSSKNPCACYLFSWVFPTGYFYTIFLSLLPHSCPLKYHLFSVILHLLCFYNENLSSTTYLIIQ